MKEIDCKGLSYVQIIREIKKYFNSIGEGEATAIVSSELERDNVIRYSTHKGYKVQEQDENRFLIDIEKRGCLELEEEENIFSILITNDTLGNADETLGNILMGEYFEALNEYDELPKAVLFLNAGVKLFSENSKVSEELRMLYDKGVKLLINDTSLNYYNMREDVTFGEIVGMYDMIVTMKKSKRLIKL
jgi:selenium metabolism protein YedF